MDDVDDEICEVAVTFIFLVACAFGLTRRWRNYTNLRSAAIPHHRHSAWAILWQRGSDNDLLVTCGIDRVTFRELHDVIFDDESNSRGRPFKLDTYAQFGMYLHFLNSTMRQKTLAQLFGVTNPTISRILRRLIVLVPRKLRRNAKCRVEWPSTDKMAQLSRLGARRMPGLTNILALWMDYQCLAKRRVTCLNKMHVTMVGKWGHLSTIFLFSLRRARLCSLR
jgi:hypothetical protein